jgi:hypothetical protein
MQRGVTPLDGIDQIDLQGLAVGSRPEAVGSFLKPDLIQKRVGGIRIIFDVFGVPLRLGK